jgi:hypothetical protein
MIRCDQIAVLGPMIQIYDSRSIYTFDALLLVIQPLDYLHCKYQFDRKAELNDLYASKHLAINFSRRCI